MGNIEFFKSLASGETVSPEMAFAQTYGLYLLHGGTPEGFDELQEDDVQLMYTAYMATKVYERRELIKDIIKILETMFKS